MFFARKNYCFSLFNESETTFKNRLFAKTVHATEKPRIVVITKINQSLFKRINSELKLCGYYNVYYSKDYSACIFSFARGEIQPSCGNTDVGVKYDGLLVVADSLMTNKSLEMNVFENFLYWMRLTATDRFFNGEKM